MKKIMAIEVKHRHTHGQTTRPEHLQKGEATYRCQYDGHPPPAPTPYMLPRPLRPERM